MEKTIRNEREWQMESGGVLSGMWVGCGYHTEVRWENKQKEVWRGRLTENEVSEVYLNRLRVVPRITSSNFLHLLFSFQQPPGSLEAVPCWKGQASSCLRAAVIKQCWADSWVYWLWSDFTNSLSINCLAEGRNTVHLFLSYIMSAYFKHVVGVFSPVLFCFKSWLKC